MRRVGIAVLLISLALAAIRINAEKRSKFDSKESIVNVTINNIDRKKNINIYTAGNIQLVSKGRIKGNLFYGDTIIAKCSEKDLDKYYIGDFNYGRYLKSCGIKKSYVIKSYKKVDENRFYRAIGNIKEKIITTNKYLYKDRSGILNAILVGDKSNIEKKEKNIFFDSGTSHVMAISGLHISIIVVLLTSIFGKIRNMKVFLLMSVFLVIYGKIVGEGASVQRAIWLIILIYISYFTDERYDIANLLFLIAGIMIFENPYVIYNISFLLSFASIFSITVLNKYFKKVFYGNVIVSTISATIATWPIILYTFKEMSIMGILGNFIAIPAITTIIFLDLASVLLYILNFSISFYLAQFNIHIINMMLYILKKIGNYGVSNIIFKDIGIRTILIYYFILIISMILLYKYEVMKNKYPITAESEVK